MQHTDKTEVLRVVIINLVGNTGVDDEALKPVRKVAVVHIARSLQSARNILEREHVDAIFLDCRHISEEKDRLNFVAEFCHKYCLFAVTSIPTVAVEYVSSGCDSSIRWCEVPDCIRSMVSANAAFGRSQTTLALEQAPILVGCAGCL